MKRILVWALVPLVLVGCSVPFLGKPPRTPAGDEASTWNPLKASPAKDLDWLVVGSVLAIGIGIAAAVNGSSSAIGWTVGAGVSLVLAIMLQRYGNLVALGAGLLVIGSVAWFIRSLFLTGGFLSLKRPNANPAPTEPHEPAAAS
jgi:hypothetical protein